MSRRTVLLLATLLALIAGVAPLLAFLMLSRERAVEGEKSYLGDYANWTLTRAAMNLDQGKDALRALQRESWDDCSPQHIERMRRLTLQNRAVDEIGFFKDGKLACTSWGMVEGEIAQNTPDYDLGDGFGLYLGIKPMVTQAGPMMALSDGHHNALIAPARMVDVLLDKKMAIGVSTADGQVIALSSDVDPALVRRLSTQVGEGMDTQHLYASVGDHGLVAFALSDVAALQGQVNRERTVLIPVAAMVSLLLIGVVVWVSRLRLSPHKELQIAIRRREFIAHYQPLIDLRSGRCVGAEALVRWRRPDGTLGMPDSFVPLAEEHGLVEQLTDLVIRAVIDDLSRVPNLDRGIHVAINISPSDMQSGRFLPVLEAALDGSGVHPSQIWLEATERGFMEAEAACRVIREARDRGHRVAIDDFGTGYSSLALLESLPVDTLKIDRSFVNAIGRDAATGIVTPHIIEICHGMGFEIVAEGVETAEQEAYLRKAGVQYAQGWLYSKALPAAEFIAYVRRRNVASVVPLRAVA